MEKSLGKFMNYTEHKVIIIYFFGMKSVLLMMMNR